MKRSLLLSIPITLVAIAFSLGFRIYIAHNVDHATQAYYYTAVDLASLMAVVFIGFRSSMTVAYQNGSDAQTITLLFGAILAFTTIFSALFLSYPIHLFVDKQVSYGYISTLFIVFGLYIYYTNRLAMFRLYKAINNVSLLEAPLLFVYFLMFSYFEIEPLEALIFSVIAQNITVALFVKTTNLKTLKEPKLQKIELNQPTREYLKNSALSSVEFVFGIVFIYIGIFCAKAFFGLYELALYQVVVKPIFMYAVMLFVFPIVKFVFPELSLLVSGQDREEIGKIRSWVRNYAIVCTLGSLLGIFLANKDGIGAIFGEELSGGYTLILILLPALYFAIMNAFYISLLKAHGRFMDSLLIRASSLLFFALIFGILQSFTQNFANVVIAIALSYLCINILSIRVLRNL